VLVPTKKIANGCPWWSA